MDPDLYNVRVRATELALQFWNSGNLTMSLENIIECAAKIEQYLLEGHSFEDKPNAD